MGAALRRNLQRLNLLQPLSLPQLLTPPPPQPLLSPPPPQQLLSPLPPQQQQLLSLPPLPLIIPHHTLLPQHPGAPVQMGPTHQDHREKDALSLVMEDPLRSGLRYLAPVTHTSVHTMDGSS